MGHSYQSEEDGVPMVDQSEPEFSAKENWLKKLGFVVLLSVVGVLSYSAGTQQSGAVGKLNLGSHGGLEGKRVTAQLLPDEVTGGDSWTDGTNQINLVGQNGNADGSPLGLCQGDCANDDDCQGNLMCHHTDARGLVLGCKGAGQPFYDYCARAPEGYYREGITYTAPPILSLALTPTEGRFPLRVCEGNCQTDAECGDGLSCLQRDGDANNYENLCSGTALTNWNYCVPTLNSASHGVLTDVAVNGNSKFLCEGDCDNDDECFGPLVCHHRTGNGVSSQLSRYCEGIPTQHTDYCVPPIPPTVEPTASPKQKPSPKPKPSPSPKPKPSPKSKPSPTPGHGNGGNKPNNNKGSSTTKSAGGSPIIINIVNK